MFNGLFSLIGLSWGNGSVSVSGPSEGPSYPPAGTYYDTQYGVEYPIAEGGSSLTNPVDSSQVPNQVCDVDREHDGSGGIVYDWTTATNVAFKSLGEIFYIQIGAVGGVPVEVPSGSGNYYDAGTTPDQAWRHDGSGSYYNTYYGTITWYSNGDETNIDVLDANTMIEVPAGNGTFFHNGEVVGYTWDGSGGYNYPVTKIAQYGNGNDTNISSLDVYGSMEVPTGSGNYYNTGDVEGYTWNGAGGYNYPVTKATRYPDGTLLWENITGTTGSVEVPSGSGNYYDSQNYGDRYTIKDPSYSPAYDYYTTWYKPNGEFIYNDGAYDYYWDGTGGYYT